MKIKLALPVVAVLATSLFVVRWSSAQPASDPLVEGFRMVEVASVADAIEQLYGQRAHMSHEMRPLFMSKCAGRAVTVLLKKEEQKDGAPAPRGRLEAIDPGRPDRFTSWCSRMGPMF